MSEIKDWRNNTYKQPSTSLASQEKEMLDRLTEQQNACIDAVRKNSNKDASVIGRGVVGGLIAGPAGAVVGALSAIDKNRRNKK